MIYVTAATLCPITSNTGFLESISPIPISARAAFSSLLGKPRHDIWIISDISIPT
jgi:hypothetical protein